MPNLYEILGVAKTAEVGEIAKAYRRAALGCHPDRNPDGAEQFKELTKAYEVLSDPQRRSLYDVTGVVPGDEARPETDEQRRQQQAAELGEEIRQFYATYRGSAEERQDLAKAYKEAGGDFETMLFETALFDNVAGEVERLHSVVNELIKENAVKLTKKWAATTTPRKLKAFIKELDDERAQAAEARKQMGVGAGASSGGDGAAGGFKGVIAARAKQQAAEWDNMADALLAKYGTGSKKAAAKKANSGDASGKKKPAKKA